jgi:hypothetical protein
MVLDRAEDLKSVMSDNATFIQFPPIGSSTSLITVYGDHRVNVQRTIRGVMQLVCILISIVSCCYLILHNQACQYYVASFWLLPIQFNVLLPPATLNSSQVTTLLKQISLSTGAEVVFKSMCFEMHGLEYEVRAAVSMILDLDLVKVCFVYFRIFSRLLTLHKIGLPS